MGFGTWLALVLALFALCFCAYLWLEQQRRVSREDLRSLLQQYSEELSKDYGRQFRAIESEWNDQYQKFSRLAGRIDREKAGPRKAAEEEPIAPTPPATRAEILKRWRNRA